MLARLHQSQMPFGQDEGRVAGQEAEESGRPVQHGKRFAQRPFMSWAADSVADHTDQVHAIAMPGEPVIDGGGRRRLSAHIQHQQDGPTGSRRQVRSRSGAVRRPVKQPHHAFAEYELRPVAQRTGQRRQGRRPHPPTVEIDAIRPGRRRMEGGVDIVGPRLRGSYGNTGPAKGAQQREGHDRLAGTAGRRGDNQTRAGHAASRTRVTATAAHCSRWMTTLSLCSALAPISSPASRRRFNNGSKA